MIVRNFWGVPGPQRRQNHVCRLGDICFIVEMFEHLSLSLTLKFLGVFAENVLILT